MKRFFRISGVLLFVGFVAACAQTFQTYYATPADPAMVKTWKLAHVNVTIPDALTVSESDALIPDADIVWHGDLPGDRKAQVALILKQSITAGARKLNGHHPVDFDVTLEKFHALSESAAKLNMSDVGVHNIKFMISVVDAKTGAVLVAPEEIDASLPALTGEEAADAAAQGNTQKVLIEDHIRKTIAGWLGVGVDQRGSFERIGD